MVINSIEMHEIEWKRKENLMKALRIIEVD